MYVQVGMHKEMTSHKPEAAMCWMTLASHSLTKDFSLGDKDKGSRHSCIVLRWVGCHGGVPRAMETEMQGTEVSFVLAKGNTVRWSGHTGARGWPSHLLPLVLYLCLSVCVCAKEVLVCAGMGTVTVSKNSPKITALFVFASMVFLYTCICVCLVVSVFLHDYEIACESMLLWVV